MELKDILVHVDNSKQSDSRLETALNIADAHTATLTGLYVITPPQIPAYMEAHIGVEVMEQEAERVRADAKEAELAFRKATENAGVTCDWNTDEGMPVDVLSRHARSSDLIIIGQRDPDGDTFASNIPDDVILNAGQPTLVVPYIGKFHDVGRRVMVAWDSSRLASRAIRDAMPFLQDALEVRVMSVNPKNSDLNDVPGADVCRFLARHGVKAEAQTAYAEDIDVSDILLSRAADAGTDLMVMGAYGHLRLRELVMGGVTRDLLKHMTMPVLMSH